MRKKTKKKKTMIMGEIDQGVWFGLRSVQMKISTENGTNIAGESKCIQCREQIQQRRITRIAKP